MSFNKPKSDIQIHVPLEEVRYCVRDGRPLRKFDKMIWEHFDGSGAKNRVLGLECPVCNRVYFSEPAEGVSR